jgi:DNA repair exonuclease SbcCD ATPase subunit
MSNILQLRQKLEQKKGQKLQIEHNYFDTVEELENLQNDLKLHEKAREIIREVGLKTQQQLQIHISNITSLALDAVFDDPYELKVDFVQRRNKTECDLTFVRDGNEVKPIDAAGVGAIDIASFALRVASWSMAQPHSRNVLILDEPFKHLRGDYENQQVLKMLKIMSEKLHLQIIMIGDVKVPKEYILEHADRVFECSIKRTKIGNKRYKVSQVKQL